MENLPPIVAKLGLANEQTWLSIGALAESMEDYPRALSAYDSALVYKPYSVPALSAMASIYRSLDHFDLAVECFLRVINITPDNGEVWGAMGHCYLMMDDLQKAYTAYHQALYYLPNPNEPKLWYGIGILYDRYGNLEHAEETFMNVVRMDPNYEKANEIYFRLGIIYKQQGQFESSLECFRYILKNPPKPLTETDIWFQIGHVYEQQGEFQLAKEAYDRVLSENANHAKVLQQLGALYMQAQSGFMDQDMAVQLLSQSLDADSNNPKTWYLLGRAYMTAEEYNKAYETYQQAVYRDGKNPVLWCSIGILYFLISQYHDALGAYSRSIRLNPYIPEIWYNLGILYESCNNQVADAIDAYCRVLELDPDNASVQKRVQLLRSADSLGKPLPSVPLPTDIPASAYLTAGTVGRSTPGTGAGSVADDMDVSVGESRDKSYTRRDEMPAETTHGPHPRSDVIPPEIRYPVRNRDKETDSPALPSYAATYNDYRNDAVHPAPASSRYHTNAAPYEWDRQYHHGPESEQMSNGSHARGGRGVGRPALPSYETERSMRYGVHHGAGYTSGRPYTSVRSPKPDHKNPSDAHASYHYGNEQDYENARARNGRAEQDEPQHDRSRHAPHSTHSPNRDASIREVDEDYDEGAASALMGLAGAATYASNSAHENEPDTSRWSLGKHGLDPHNPSAPKRARLSDLHPSPEPATGANTSAVGEKK
ncbi:glucose repression mediator protein [Malassezia vespertilionis]|uniref:glucose repression mediator protein n=1 Tax=Malassezia vespertilionis TaxID=2020962 RepID=UPI0024B0C856|nr:glucose repression mediator protein [Malassezia vespertilionis]WFD05336.1 glucose repression mediator protein [Malassezia vespertilionis]